jgi:hypothetical protein
MRLAARSRVPWLLRLRAAVSAVWTCLRGRDVVCSVPFARRTPGMCRDLGECVRRCHEVEQTRAKLWETACELREAREQRT